MNIIGEIAEIKTKLWQISDAVADDKFLETIKVQHPGYFIDKLKSIEKDTRDLIGQIKHRAKEAS